MKKLALTLSALVTFSSFLSISANACTDFRIAAKDGSILVTRSMEFAQEMNSNLRNGLRGRQFAPVTLNGKPSLGWKGKYGFLYVDGLNQDIAIDGMNENGLSFEYLYLPGETQYQTAPAGKEGQALPYYELGQWVLSNFKTVDEVRQALATIFVVAMPVPGLGNNITFPVHASIYDSTGKGIVVEFVGGKMNIFDNAGILTNSPTYDWQVTNLRNYINLSPYIPKPVIAGGLTFTATGQGTGMVGLPGDSSPPSRFVKIATMLKSVYPVATMGDALNMAQHLINNVDLPAGFSRSVDNGQESSDITQWVVFKDLTNKMFYYRTYNDMTVRSIVMSKLDFSEKGALFKMPLSTTPTMSDQTNAFMAATSAAPAATTTTPNAPAAATPATTAI